MKYTDLFTSRRGLRSLLRRPASAPTRTGRAARAPRSSRPGHMPMHQAMALGMGYDELTKR
ncbi:hypothetical protein KLP28_01115 [Nocardioidaceae bacterium]|nr:hypothetical protein KLP28_01115 [Nocardioidaceae bacterium]